MSETRRGQTVADWQPIETAPRDQNVLIATSDKVVGEAYYWDDDGWYWVNNDPSDAWGGPVYGATHWAYLPPPPEVR